MDQILEEVKRVAREAGKITLEIYNQDFHTEKKEDNSPVTEADIAADKFIREQLQKFNYPFLTEESQDDKTRLKHSRIWVVDPIDGTRGFVKKRGDFSIMIGLVEDQRPILGVVYRPTTGELYYAQKGHGAFVEKNEESPKELKVTNKKDHITAAMSSKGAHFLQQDKRLIDELNVQVIHIGSIGLKIALITEQKCDFTFKTTNKTNEWDTCAPEIILQEAGGMMTDLKGNTLKYNQEDTSRPYGHLASNTACHEKVLNILKTYTE